MENNIKLAAEKLYKLADELEKSAFENTFFVCNKCNHTASLAEINEKRKIASEKLKVGHTSLVTVNDRIKCAACEGIMSYVASEDSMKFYVEAEDIPEQLDEEITDGEITDETPEDENSLEENPDENSDEDITEEDVSSIFEPVDEQNQMSEDESSVSPEAAPSDVNENPSSAIPGDEPPVLPEDKSLEAPEEVSKEVSQEELPEEDNTEDDSLELDGSPEDEDAVIEETIEEDLPKKKNKDINIPKGDVPKFEKMPKEAQDAFLASVAKYSM